MIHVSSLNSKDNSKNFACNHKFCHEKFSSESQMEMHLKLHDSVQPFRCKVCGKICLTQNKLNIHEKSHKKEMVKPSCKSCNRIFSRVSGLNRHIRNIHKNKPFKCIPCQSGFEKEEYLEIHNRRYHSEKTSVSSFTHNNDINTNEDSLSPSSKQLTDFKANDAAFEENSSPPIDTTTLHSLKNNTTLPDNPPQFSCNLCTATFPYSSYLQQHMSVHYSEKQPCHICGFSFATFKDLANHLRTHTADEQSKVTLDFSTYGESSYFPFPSFPASSHQTSFNPIQYPTQSFSHQFYPYQQQQQSFYFPSHSHQTSTYSPSFQYTMPFYPEKRSSTSLLRDESNSFDKPYNSFPLQEREISSHSSQKYYCHRCHEYFLTYDGLNKHQERCLSYPMI